MSKRQMNAGTGQSLAAIAIARMTAQLDEVDGKIVELWQAGHTREAVVVRQLVAAERARVAGFVRMNNGVTAMVALHAAMQTVCELRADRFKMH